RPPRTYAGGPGGRRSGRCGPSPGRTVPVTGWHARDRIAVYAEEPGASAGPLCRLTEMGD
ncbi:hypothetical protein, partial [Streptomyces scabiei]|uniref:hypothetical protein n=1 Tax=Streptomyces scabiei TaxID=1930 RepID=UPI0029B1EC22